MASSYVPGVAFAVTNTITPDENVFACAVEDTVPAGWLATNVNQGGSFDAASHTVQWGPFFDGAPRALTYQVLPPPDANAIATFSGVGQFNLSDSIEISGQTTIAPAFSNAIVRTLPPTFQPGATFSVTNTVSAAPNIATYAVEDTLPAGWLATNINNGGAFDSATGKILWGPFFDSVSRTLVYSVMTPADASGTVSFTGQGNFGGLNVPITGQTQSTAIANPIGTATRSLPAMFNPGQSFTVSCTVNPGTNVSVFAIQDTVPVGWIATNINQGGTFDSQNHVVNWGPFFGQSAVKLTYVVVAPGNATGSNFFSGTAVFNDSIVPISGNLSTVATSIVPGSVTRSFGSNYTPGILLSVTNLAVPGSNVTIYAVQEIPPAGWAITNISDSGSRDVSGVISWGPFFDATPRSLTYQLLPPAGATNIANFSGTAFFNDQNVVTTGQSNLTATPIFRGSVVRSLPSSYIALGFVVSDVAIPAGNCSVYAVQDQLPTGWSAMNISDGGTFESATGTILWGPFFDNQPRTLEFIALPVSPAPQIANFSGTAVFDNITVIIAGQRQSILTNRSVPLPPPPALFSSPVVLHSGVADGRFQFDITNAAASNAMIYTSTNQQLPFSQWQPLGAPTLLSNGVYRFSEPITNGSARYFILR